MDKPASHLERLKKAGVFDADVEITDDEKVVVQRLTDDEVETLIRMYRKLGPTAKGREKIRPCFPL
jgi:hypothetical protein